MDRIIIGKSPDTEASFPASNHRAGNTGLFISKPGANVMSCSDGELLFDSTAPDFMQVLAKGIAEIPPADSVYGVPAKKTIHTKLPSPYAEENATVLVRWAHLSPSSNLHPTAFSDSWNTPFSESYATTPPHITLESTNLGNPTEIGILPGKMLSGRTYANASYYSSVPVFDFYKGSLTSPSTHVAPNGFGSQPTWSPGPGSEIAFCGYVPGGKVNIFKFTGIDQNNPSEITSSPTDQLTTYNLNIGAPAHPEFSRDGDKIVYQFDDALWIMDSSDGGNKTKISDGSFLDPSWNRGNLSNDEFICHSSSIFTIFTKVASSWNQTTVPIPAGMRTGGYSVIEPKWSPDGERILFRLKSPGVYSWWGSTHTYSIWTIDRDGQNLLQHTGDFSTVAGACWSPDGTRISFYGNPKDGSEIFTSSFIQSSHNDGTYVAPDGATPGHLDPSSGSGWYEISGSSYDPGSIGSLTSISLEWGGPGSPDIKVKTAITKEQGDGSHIIVETTPTNSGPDFDLMKHYADFDSNFGRLGVGSDLIAYDDLAYIAGEEHFRFVVSSRGKNGEASSHAIGDSAHFKSLPAGHGGLFVFDQGYRYSPNGKYMISDALRNPTPLTVEEISLGQYLAIIDLSNVVVKSPPTIDIEFKNGSPFKNYTIAWTLYRAKGI